MTLISFPFSAILGWSASRHDAFSFCKRHYYYQYYPKFDSEHPVAKIQTLKGLTSRALAIGSLAHLGIEALLKRLEKSTAPIDLERFSAYMKQQAALFVQQNKFEEEYYKSGAVPDAAELGQAALDYVQQFLNSQRYAWISALPDATRKNWMIEPGGYGETRINDLKAYCKVDFLLQHNGITYIFDWKTGKEDPEKHAKQMLGYALFAQTNLGVPFDQIELQLHYLSGTETQVHIGEGDLQKFEERVQSETQEMYSYCSNIESNIPLPKESFPMTEQERLCGYCKFRELCGRA